MAINAPRGFTEYRHLSGAVTPATRMYRARDNGDAGQMQQNAIRAGDPVVLVSGNRVARIVSVLSAAPTVGSDIVGVARAVYSNKDGKPRSFTHGAVGYIAASADGWVDVNIDPHQTYLVKCQSTVTPAVFGRAVTTTALATPLNANYSGMSLEIGSPVLVATTASPFVVLGFGAGDENNLLLTAGDPNSNFAGVEVVIGKHLFK